MSAPVVHVTQSQKWLPWLILTLTLAALFMALGVWQLERGEVKTRMQADFAAALVATPQPAGRYLEQPGLPSRIQRDDASGGDTMVHSGPMLPARIVARGHFDPAATVILDNQVLDGRPGVHVLVLFQAQSAPRPLLVNLGWQPLPDRNRVTLPVIPAGEVQVRGLLVPPPAVGVRLGNAAWYADVPPPLLAYLDIAALRTQMGVELFEGQLLLDEDLDFGLRRRWQALPNTSPPERHRGYAVQWFALALAVLVVFALLARRRLHPKGESTS